MERQATVRINDVGLFVDDRGSTSAPPLLYIHGGPGQSAWDFMAAQGDRLARRLRIIGVDQRGVLRSDELPPDTALDIDELIDDFEALRERLGIEAWAILGHSAGGGYALRYATREPQAVRAVIFDRPCWDGDLTDRYRLPVAADRLEAAGQGDAAGECRRIARKPERITVADEPWTTMQALGARYLDLFFCSPDSAVRYKELMGRAGFTEEEWSRGRSHAPLLAAMYEPQLHLLAGLGPPSLLVHGLHDLVVPPGVVETYERDVTAGAVHTFDSSGHFAYHEEPDAYNDVVSNFVSLHAG